jgi:predicted dehydrogenase
MKQLKIGLIGCGAAARKYYLPVLKIHPEINVFLVDMNLDLAKSTALELGSQFYTNNYADIVQEVEGVIIAVPHFHHYQIAEYFLKNNIHVLCEKPLAETAREVDGLVNTADQHSVVLCVNNTRRILPCFQMAKESVLNNIIGQFLSIRYLEANKFDWESQTGFYNNPKLSSKGVLLDIGAHVLDLVCWFLDGKPDLISYEDDSFGGPESLALVKAKYGKCHIEILLNRLVDLDNFLTIEGENGFIDIDLKNINALKIRTKTGKIKTITRKINSEDKSNMARPIIENFFMVVEGKDGPIVPGKAVINSIRLIDECYNTRKRFEMPMYQNFEYLMNE